MPNKRNLTERDICTKYITPALEKAGWDTITQILEEYPLTKGRVIVRGKLHTRAKNKRADYVLFYKPNIPIAIIEAKDNNHSVRAGIQQGLDYAHILDIPFVFSSNGDGFLFHDKTAKDNDIEKELDLESFPTPEELWEITEVRDFVNDLDEVFPYWLYFLSKKGFGLYVILKCFLLPHIKPEAQNQINGPRLQEYLLDRGFKAMNYICELTGISEDENAQMTSRFVAYWQDPTQ